VDLPPQVIKAFVELGDAQRGLPESAMLAVHDAMGGGILNPVVENVGDIIHRMTHMIGWWPDPVSSTGLDYVENKVSSSLRYLTNKYGFEREFRENIVNNAKYDGRDPKAMKAAIDKALARYAYEHGKLPVYNHPQYLARGAAIAVGKQDFPKAVAYLKGLKGLTRDPKKWAKAASAYRLGPNGEVLQYPWPEGMREPSRKPFPPGRSGDRSIDEILSLLGARK
jgi:hypothetical protein